MLLLSNVSPPFDFSAIRFRSFRAEAAHHKRWRPSLFLVDVRFGCCCWRCCCCCRRSRRMLLPSMCAYVYIASFIITLICHHSRFPFVKPTHRHKLFRADKSSARTLYFNRQSPPTLSDGRSSNRICARCSRSVQPTVAAHIIMSRSTHNLHRSARLNFVLVFYGGEKIVR